MLGRQGSSGAASRSSAGTITGAWASMAIIAATPSAGRRSGRAADHERGFEQDLPVATGAIAELLEQQIRCHRPDLALGNANRGQRRPQSVDEGHVVET